LASILKDSASYLKDSTPILKQFTNAKKDATSILKDAASYLKDPTRGVREPARGVKDPVREGGGLDSILNGADLEGVGEILFAFQPTSILYCICSGGLALAGFPVPI